MKNNNVSSRIDVFNIVELSGSGNVIDIKTTRISKEVKLYLKGNNNKIVIEQDVTLLGGVIYVEDDNNEICIKRNTTIYDAELAAAEGCKLIVGENCLFSKEIRICTTDSHSVVDKNTGERLNYGSSIIIGDHVWIGYRTAVNKGVSVGRGSVIGGYSVVTHDIPEYSCAVGVPAKVIRNDIAWKHERK